MNENKSLFVMKESMSTVDFIESFRPDIEKLTIYNSEYLKKVKPGPPRNESKEHNYDGNSLFEIDGIRFSLEICLDHIKHRVSKSEPPLNKPVDVQLVASCGVDLPHFKVNDNLSDNGVAFLVDGYKSVNSSLKNKKGNPVIPLSQKTFEPKNIQVFDKLFNSKGKVTIYPVKTLVKTKEKDIKI